MGFGMMDRLYHGLKMPLFFKVRAFERCDHGQHLKDKPQYHVMGATKKNPVRMVDCCDTQSKVVAIQLQFGKTSLNVHNH